MHHRQESNGFVSSDIHTEIQYERPGHADSGKPGAVPHARPHYGCGDFAVFSQIAHRSLSVQTIQRMQASGRPPLRRLLIPIPAPSAGRAQLRAEASPRAAITCRRGKKLKMPGHGELSCDAKPGMLQATRFFLAATGVIDQCLRTAPSWPNLVS